MDDQKFFFGTVCTGCVHQKDGHCHHPKAAQWLLAYGAKNCAAMLPHGFAEWRDRMGLLKRQGITVHFKN
ncbi:MAG: hypothetical protein H7A09_10585 [Oceanospirillaceae bacterium]|nr:hypothetical protein [Oceanospirillaceae bacterium]